MISFFIFVTFFIQIYNFWLFSHGFLKKSYYATLFAYTGFIVSESMIALNAPGQSSVFLFVILDVWAIFMSIKGLIRIKKEESV